MYYVLGMSDAQIVAKAAEDTAANLFRWADGAENPTGAKADPQDIRAIVQCAGAFQHFAAQIRMGIDAKSAELMGVLP